LFHYLFRIVPARSAYNLEKCIDYTLNGAGEQKIPVFLNYISHAYAKLLL
jgi:hypothetical protein